MTSRTNELGHCCMITGPVKDPFKFIVTSFSHVQLTRHRFEVGRNLDLYRLVIWSNDYNKVTVKQRN